MTTQEKFVVIGSNSFSGACFIDYILQSNLSAEVIGISRSPEYNDCFLPYKTSGFERFYFYQLDLNKDLRKMVEVIREFCPNYIVNFSAQGMVTQSWDRPEQWFQTNCLGTMSLVNELKGDRYLKRYVQVSSPEVYGSCDGNIKEDMPLNPSTPYAASKACGDLSLIPYYKNYGFPLVYTRATNVYGAYQQLYRIIPRTILYIKMGKKIKLQGGGKAMKSYIHIQDVCDATVKISRNGTNGEIYHISPKDGGISIYDLVARIIIKLGEKPDDWVEIVEDRKGQDSKYIIDSSKVRNELGWVEKIDLDKGIDKVITWVETFYEELVNLPQEYIHKP
ncbi:MAG TPA: NAD-dependent epimerase/dehydratase family protein [Nitrospinaceae bacterium]|nr:NAD-dependent epimerase/dehydratase family protein [Nitrospina sp.]HIN87162.1 NAD-dependent epimerase/dehydratase family protein [Nitrospinaceae bacterium]